MTKSTITREQLIKKAQEQIEFCRHTKITGEGRAHVNQCAALFEIALAAMDSEPVAYIFKHPAGRLFWSLTDESNKGHDDVMPVYARPQPAPEEWTIADAVKFCKETGRQDAGSAMDAWNACRAAMLHAGNSPAKNGVAPAQSGNSPAIPDGYVLVPKEARKEILDEFDSIIDYGAEDSVDAWHRLLAAATQEVKP
ncbi:hypothetical protein ACV1E0_08640 [Klebsiella pneumoniae]|nr:hypothetical protein [Klebsiella pneumoniae]HBY6814971.1 hypothetical protein [Klebsiella pneumoniae]